MNNTILVKRVYDNKEKTDGYRILVDRLWPRGIKKEDAHVDVWAKELAPSKELFTWFHQHKATRFTEFTKKYTKELNQISDTIEHIIGSHKKITLVTSVKEIEHSHIPTLKNRLEHTHTKKK